MSIDELEFGNGRVGTDEEEENQEEDRSTGNWFNEKYHWLTWVDTLADGKRRDWDFFLDMNVLEFLSAIVYRMDRNENERQVQELQSKMYRSNNG